MNESIRSTPPPAVSVVLIFFNEYRFLDDAIKSVLAQTCPDWELLLVDDGSTDGSADIALRYAREYPARIRYLTHNARANRGPSASRNLGIRHARGRFFAFLDGDDVWLPEKLIEQLAIMSGEPRAAMIYGHSQHWHSWTRHPEDAVRDHVPQIGTRTGVPLPGRPLLAEMVNRRVLTPCPSSILVRADAALAIGGFEDGFRNVYEDQVFTAKMCLFAAVLVAPNTWDRYRQHADSAYAIARRTGDGNIARISFLEWLQSYLIEHQISDAALSAVIQSELRNAITAQGAQSLSRRRRPSQDLWRAALRSILHRLRGANAQL
jgi:glycosyltransferase involved in cell wall biosynthesis